MVSRPRTPPPAYSHTLDSSSDPITDVAIFWDVENCSLPKSVSPVDFVCKLRDQFLSRNRREAQFLAVLNTTHAPHLATTLQELNVIVMPALKQNKKNAADEILRQKMRQFVDVVGDEKRIKLILISGDVDFSTDLHTFRYVRKHEVFLLHNNQAKDSLKSMANKAFSFEGFIKSLRKPIEQK